MIYLTMYIKLNYTKLKTVFTVVISFVALSLGSWVVFNKLDETNKPKASKPYFSDPKES